MEVKVSKSAVKLTLRDRETKTSANYAGPYKDKGPVVAKAGWEETALLRLTSPPYSDSLGVGVASATTGRTITYVGRHTVALTLGAMASGPLG